MVESRYFGIRNRKSAEKEVAVPLESNESSLLSDGQGCIL